MKDVILLGLKAIDFKGTDFCLGRCAIERALDRNYPELSSAEGVITAKIDGVEYSHERYGMNRFATDKALASTLTDEEIVRVITLTKV